MRRTTVAFVGIALGLVACKGGRSKSEDKAAEKKPMATSAPESPALARDEAEEGELGFAENKAKSDKKSRRKGSASAHAPSALAAAKDEEAAPEPDASAVADSSELGAPTRSWFPETFLFEPLVVTNDRGAAEVGVRVPDRLTSWRVLALAHSRKGAQAGAVATFLGTLPTYVDPVVPPFVRAGDRVRIPVQLVNTTPRQVTSQLSLEAANATLVGGQGAVQIPASGAAMRYTTLTAKRPGSVRFQARLGDADAVVRTIDVFPTGKPATEVQSGTLAAARAFELAAAAGSDPSLDRVRLTVFPGALALLRSELAAARGRGGVADDAFGLLLAGRAPEILRAFGDEPDTDALRELSIVLTQRVVRYARVLDMSTATLLAEAALAHPQNPVLENIGRRAVSYIAEEQLPDGTCGGETGWSLQRLLVATADCARAAASEQRVVIRASGAFERHADEIADPYTAAAVLAAGAVDGRLADSLRDKVRGAIEPRKDGSKVLAVPEDVVRADGVRPSTLEATALAVLALEGDPKAPLADLGAAILAGYSPSWGWGDGRANLVCMQAVQRLFKDPVPPDTRIVLSMDGKPVAEGTLSRERVREVMTLAADSIGASGSHHWEVKSEPAVPGLGFSLSVTTWGPWPKPSAGEGVELSLQPPAKPVAGKPAIISVRAVAPAGRELEVRVSLPAGVQPDTGALDVLVEQGTLARYETSDGLVEMYASGLEPAEVFSAELRVIPTLTGTLQTGASSLEVGSLEVFVPPTSWTVR